VKQKSAPMLLTYINLAVIFHCLILGIFFYSRSKEGIGRTNFYLGSFLILIAEISFSFAMKSTGWIFKFPYLVDLDWAAGFWLAPFYLWYAKEMTGERIEFNWKQYSLLLPGCIAFIYFSKFYFKTAEEQLAYLVLIQKYTYIEEYQIADLLFYSYILVYFSYVIVLLYRRKNKVSGIFRSNCIWLLKYSIMVLFFGFLSAVINIFSLPQIYLDMVPMISGVLYMVLIYRFVIQSGKYVPFEEGGLKEQKTKYTNSNLEVEDALRVNEDLRLVMEQDKLYLMPDLTLQVLSKEVNVKPHHLSQIINQYHQKNFSDFVNDYRVKEAQRLIVQNVNLKLEAIGYDSGFNTKATFNAAFKKIIGCTPSEYRKKEQEKEVKTYNI
jgi:AraC-like DNA-binding protein